MKQQIETKKAKLQEKIEKLDRDYMERVDPLKNEMEKLDAMITIISEYESKPQSE